VRRLLPALSLAVALLCAGCGKSSGPAELPRNQAAVVNGVVISVDKLNAVAKADQAAAASGQQQGAPPSGPDLNRQALGELVQSEIVLQAAKQQGIDVSDADVAARLGEIRAQVTAQHADFDQVLAQRGLTLQLLSDQLRPQIAAQRLSAKLVPAKVSDADLAKRRAEFPELHVRHILVKDKATAAKVRAQLAAGGDWGKLAKQYSQDSGSKDRGGDLGYTSKGETVVPFDKTAFALAGQGSCKGRTSGACASPLSQPVKSEFGYHVIQVIGIRLPAVDDQLREKVEPGLQQRRQQALQRWFKDVAAKAQVRINPTYGSWDAANARVVDPSAPTTGGAPASTS
jgi:parvulin-like peptidyl-prolyl isomerase